MAAKAPPLLLAALLLCLAAPPPAAAWPAGGLAARSARAAAALAGRLRAAPRALGALLAADPHAGATPAERAVLAATAAAPGAIVGYTIGRACPTCLRGAVATRAFRAGEVVARVPLSLGIPLVALEHQGFSAEYAYHLVVQMMTNATWNATHGAFWAVHPAPGEVLGADVMTADQISQLQCPELARLVEQHQRVAAQVYDGTLSWGDYEPLNDALARGGAASNVSLQQFRHVAALVGSRDFGFWLRPGASVPDYYLLPVADMVNHEEDANAERTDDGEAAIVTALRDIAAGEAVTNNYQPGVLQRADMTLYIYGFVAAPPEGQARLLPAVDLPTYTTEDPFGRTALDDAGFYGPAGANNTAAEAARLSAALEAMPTTEAEDEALLAGGALGWQDAAVVRFRLERKRALRAAIRAIDLELFKADVGRDVRAVFDDDLAARFPGLAAAEAAEAAEAAAAEAAAAGGGGGGAAAESHTEL